HRIKRSRAKGMVARPKRGCTCVTTHLIQATARPTITARLIGHTSRRSSLTCPKGLLSLVAELFSSNTCRHRPHKAGRQFHSHFGPIRISYRQHLPNQGGSRFGLPSRSPL